jgi:hypothetical protein
MSILLFSRIETLSVTSANVDARVAKYAAHPVKSRFGEVRLKENIFPLTLVVVAGVAALLGL